MFEQSVLQRRSRIGRARRGFTMAEILAALLILGILFAIAAPNVVKMQRDMRTMELNAKAQQIYNAAQYNLSSLKSLDQLYKLVYEKPATGATDEQRSLASIAVAESGAIDRSTAYTSDSEYTSDGHAAATYGLYAANRVNATVATYMVTPDDNAVTNGVTPGEFWIEFSPSTGEVYSVFYYEPQNASDATTYPSYTDMSQNRASRDWLADNKVGYYGGKPLSPAVDLKGPKEDIADKPKPPTGDPTWADLNMSVVNKEELYVHLTATDLNDPNIFNKIKISVKVTGYDRNKWMQKETWERTYSNDGTADDTLEFVPGAKEADVVLDSMRQGMAITDIFPNLIPGSDVDVTVRLSYNGKTVKELTFSTNSLFASIKDEKAQINSLRHLNNLDLLRKYLAAGYTAEEMSNLNHNYVKFTGIDMQTDIEFDGHKWADEDVSLQSRQDFVGNGLNPLASYEPITLSPVMEASPGNYTFEGNGHTFRNFVIAKYKRDSNGNYVRDESGNFVLDEAGENTGMVSTSCIKFQNMNFLDPVVIGGNNTGVLAGTHKAGSISNVHIYTTKGGDSYVSGNDNVGGLVGSLADPKVNAWIGFDNCSSTVDVRGGSYVGGIVGNGGTFSSPKNSYVGYRDTGSGYEANRVVSITGTGDYVGGMCGSMSMPSENNHVLANVSGNSNVGGLAGYVSRASSIENSDVGDPNGVYRTSVIASGDNVGGVAGYSDAGSNRCAYQSFSYVNTVEGRDNVGGFTGNATGRHEQCGARGAVSSNGLVVETTVSGRNNVGGFVGLQSSGEFLDSYAACTVSGSGECCGGFTGQITSGQAHRCYSSGGVTGNTWVGGFMGYRADSYMTNCYTTSNVKAYSHAGGFVGEYAASAGQDVWTEGLRAYGKLTPRDGADESTFGGFVGVCASRFNPSQTTTYYLCFDGYNNYPDTASFQPRAYTMQECQNAGGTAVNTAYPQSSDLLGVAFPFGGVANTHYGDWYAG